MAGVRPPSQRSRPRPQAEYKPHSQACHHGLLCSHCLFLLAFLACPLVQTLHQQQCFSSKASTRPKPTTTHQEVAGKISIETILSELGVKREAKPLTVNLRAIRRRLETEAILKDIRCGLPDTIDISFKERCRARIICGTTHATSTTMPSPSFRHQRNLSAMCRNPHHHGYANQTSSSEEANDKHLLAALELLQIQTSTRTMSFSDKQIQLVDTRALIVDSRTQAVPSSHRTRKSYSR